MVAATPVTPRDDAHEFQKLDTPLMNHTSEHTRLTD